MALKLRVPEAKVVETSIKEEEEKMDEEMEAERWGRWEGLRKVEAGWGRKGQ